MMTTMMFRAAAHATALAVSLGTAPAVAAANDGFVAYWQGFAAAAAKDDQAALAKMVVLSDRLDEATPLTFAKFHHDYLGPEARKCLAKTKPVGSVDADGQLGYSVICGEAMYFFYRSGGAWKLTDIGLKD